MSSEYLITNIQTIHWSCFIVTICTLWPFPLKMRINVLWLQYCYLGPLKSGPACLTNWKLRQSLVSGRRRPGPELHAVGAGLSPSRCSPVLSPLLSRPQPSSSSSATSCGRRATPRRLSLCSRPWSTSHSSSPTVWRACPPKARCVSCLSPQLLSPPLLLLGRGVVNRSWW